MFAKCVLFHSDACSNSDIWRDGPRFLIPIFSFLYLNNAKGCRTSVVAAVSDDLPAHCYYLQPYWLPGTSQAVAPFPALEMLGPYQGYHVTTARLPADGGMAAASALWIACADISGATWPQPK